MSASVATPMAGLPNYDFNPDNMPDFTATDFPDHMELDRSTDLGDNYVHHNNSSSEAQRQSSADDYNNVTSNEQALGNLLGALTKSQEQSGDRTNLERDEEGSYMTQAQHETNAHVEHEFQSHYGLSRLPSFDATAANEIFSNEDLTQLGIDSGVPQSSNTLHVSNMANNNLSQDSDISHSVKRPITPQQREFEAFARLQFEDGSYYLNTYSCELGRDVLAYRAALEKEKEERNAEQNVQERSQGSSGRVSHPSGHRPRPLGSQVQGSVVSEQGGFAGIDEAPMRPPANPERPTVSSQESESSVVKPAEYLINPRTMPSFDYHRSTEMQAKITAQEEGGEPEVPDTEEPAAVTTAHMPNPHMCPLIPIHGRPKEGQTDAEVHKKISRRHVKIQWSFEGDRWEMKVHGRNGAFCDKDFVPYQSTITLHHGAVIQIAHVALRFLLPKTTQQQEQEKEKEEAQSADLDLEREVDADEALPSVEPSGSVSIASDGRRESVADTKSTPKISLKISTVKTEPTPPELPLGPDGLPIVKRRGPGRPPKDGVMSHRERKEREKAARLIAAREANGGKTPPPLMRGKPSRPTPPAVEEARPDPKPEKRKYTKRKTLDGDGNPTQDDDGEEGEAGSDGEPKAKKSRTQREKSESPVYPPRESLTADQLARPPESYAILLHRILCELYPRALPLKDIYRELKKRFPWYVYEAQTEGWQSSVRHNLNSEFGKLFDKGDKEGKGFAWRAIPNAQLPQTEKKRAAQAPTQRPRPQPQRPQFQPLPGQNSQWQTSGPFPTNGPQPFTNQNPWPQQSQATANWPQNATLSTGMQQQQLPPAVPGMPPQRPSQTPQPGLPLDQAQAQSSRGPSNSAPLLSAPQAPGAHTGTAASNMPCTLDGIEAIKRFEVEMFKQLRINDGPPDKIDFWSKVFASAKKRSLHGYPASLLPDGEGKEEATIMIHMKRFIDRFANPNFKGFTQRLSQPAATEVQVVPQPGPHDVSTDDSASPVVLSAVGEQGVATGTAVKDTLTPSPEQPGALPAVP